MHIKRVVRSTLPAGTLSLQEGLETGYYHREMLKDILGLEQKVKIEAYVDNRSAREAILSTRLVEDKRLRIDIAAISYKILTFSKMCFI